MYQVTIRATLKCPFCGKKIKARTTICPHCKKNISIIKF